MQLLKMMMMKRRRRKKNRSPSALDRSRKRHARFLEKKLAGKPDLASPEEDQQDSDNSVCVKELENTSLSCGSNSDLVSSENPTPSPIADQHAHSYFCLGVHVPPGVSIWGYMFIFEGTHILELFFHSKRIEAMKSDHLDVYNSDIIML